MLTPYECGRLCRGAFADLFKSQLGPFRLKGRKILFRDQTVFAAYSDFHTDISQWFYGIPRVEWEDWPNQSLVLLMKQVQDVSYLLLDPKEATSLLAKCGQDKTKDEKKINIRRPISGERIYIIEWENLPIHSRIARLPLLWPS